MISNDGFLRWRVVSADLATGDITVPPIAPPIPAPRRARVLVTLHDHPLGTVEVENTTDGIPHIDVVRELAWQNLSHRIREHLTEDRLSIPDRVDGLATLADSRSCALNLTALPTETPLVSVVVSTVDNVDSLVQTVNRILSGTYEHLEVLVVDNSPHVPDTEAALAQRLDDDRVFYIAEHRRGLSRARNAGLARARGELVVFVDDDVIVSGHWLSAIAHAFSGRPEVACVTGSIVAAELETPAQIMLEQFGGFHKGSRRETYDLRENRRDSALYPYDSGRFGSGANMAFRTSVAKQLGGFTEALGAGTPAHGGEDIDILRRVVSGDHTLIYEPAALMWHRHRRSYVALERQLFRYGVGLTATVTKWLLDDRKTAWEVLRRVLTGLRYIASPRSNKNRRKSQQYPKALTRLEALGMILGPFAYFRSRSRAKKPGLRSPHEFTRR